MYNNKISFIIIFNYITNEQTDLSFMLFHVYFETLIQPFNPRACKHSK